MKAKRPVGRPRKNWPVKESEPPKVRVEVADDQVVGHLNVRPHGHARNELEERINDLSDSWETESLFEDVIEDISEDRFINDGNYIFTLLSPFFYYFLLLVNSLSVVLQFILTWPYS